MTAANTGTSMPKAARAAAATSPNSATALASEVCGNDSEHPFQRVPTKRRGFAAQRIAEGQRLLGAGAGESRCAYGVGKAIGHDLGEARPRQHGARTLLLPRADG